MTLLAERQSAGQRPLSPFPGQLADLKNRRSFRCRLGQIAMTEMSDSLGRRLRGRDLAKEDTSDLYTSTLVGDKLRTPSRLRFNIVDLSSLLL